MNARELKLERCVDAFQGFGQLPIPTTRCCLRARPTNSVELAQAERQSWKR
jgi:hypothetical protein